jgi:hypothetical protein
LTDAFTDVSVMTHDRWVAHEGGYDGRVGGNWWKLYHYVWKLNDKEKGDLQRIKNAIRSQFLHD